MPRNSSGTYSLYTPGNPVVTNTVISSSWANNTLADLASALTDSLSRSGDGGMQAPLELDNGAVGAPGLTWATETTSGLYRASAGNFRFSISAADVLTLTAAATTIATPTVIGAATGGAQGAGTINATGVYDDGVLLANQAGANPTGTVGLAAVNGVATTFLRSDGAPALSQAIVPTWTGVHTFSGAANRVVVNISSGNDMVTLQNGGVAKGYLASDGSGSGLFSGAGETGQGWYVSSTSALVQTNSLTRATFANDGGLFMAGATGSSQGAGTINATGIYDDGLQIFPNVPRSTTTTTLVASDLGKCVAVSAAIAIPASVFSAGDAISVYNDSGSAVNITIAAGTLRLAGTTTTGTRSLAARGMATLWFNVGGATPEVIASGSVT